MTEQTYIPDGPGTVEKAPSLMSSGWTVAVTHDTPVSASGGVRYRLDEISPADEQGPDLEAIRARLTAVGDYTANWTRDTGNHDWTKSYAVAMRSLWSRTHFTRADIDLIAHAPADLTALLAEVERLRERADASE